MENETPPAQPLAGKWLGLFVSFLLALALVATLASGTPKPLPAVALGSAVVLHTERAVALFAALLLMVVVLVRAFQGRLPQELSGRGLKYAEREGTEEIRDTTAAAQEGLETALEELDRRVELLEEGLAAEAESHEGAQGKREQG